MMTTTKRHERARTSVVDETHLPYNRFSFRIRNASRKFDNVNRSRVAACVVVIVSRRFNRVKDIDPQVKAEHVHGR